MLAGGGDSGKATLRAAHNYKIASPHLPGGSSRGLVQLKVISAGRPNMVYHRRSSPREDQTIGPRAHDA
jgi:hypothetical protein